MLLQVDRKLTSQRRHVSVAAAAIDAAVIVAAFAASAHVYGLPWQPAYATLAAMAVVLFFVIGELGGRSDVTPSPLRSRSRASIRAWCIVVTLLFALGYATKTSAIFSRRLVVTWIVLTPLALMAWRSAATLCARRFRPSAGRRVAILGAGRLGIRLARTVQKALAGELHALSFYDDSKALGPADRVTGLEARIVGRSADLIRHARQGQIDCVFVALPMRAEPRVQEVVTALADSFTDVFVVPDLFKLDFLYPTMGELDGLPILNPYAAPFDGTAAWLKRFEDLVLGSLLMVVAAVPMLVIAALVKATSRGPVLFVQRRHGRNGRLVRILKFRTMSVCEDDAEVRQTQEGDPQVTRLGAILRKTSLDELPQLLNVLAGSMSLVGPRPHAVAHNEEYRVRIPTYMLRHRVRPGMTGWAQVHGLRGPVNSVEDMKARIQYDFEYIRNWSFHLDLHILLKTLGLVLADVQSLVRRLRRESRVRRQAA